MTGRRPGPARHERPEIDELALAAAGEADRLLAGARARGLERWQTFLAPIPGQLRDGDMDELRRAARRARAAYGAKDSIRDALPTDLTEPFLERLDRLLRGLARDEAQR